MLPHQHESLSASESSPTLTPDLVIRLFTKHRARLRRLVEWKLDHRLRGRIDPSDVLQETHFEIVQRAADYIANVQMPPYVWFRRLTEQRVAGMHRKHLGAQMRAAQRDVSIDEQPDWQIAAPLADCLLDQLTSPSSVAIRTERHAILRQTLLQLNAIDREILLLRHFEGLTNSEAAQVLDLKVAATSNRYMRALLRLRELLEGRPDFELR